MKAANAEQTRQKISRLELIVVALLVHNYTLLCHILTDLLPSRGSYIALYSSLQSNTFRLVAMTILWSHDHKNTRFCSKSTRPTFEEGGVWERD